MSCLKISLHFSFNEAPLQLNKTLLAHLLPQMSFNLDIHTWKDFLYMKQSAIIILIIFTPTAIPYAVRTPQYRIPFQYLCQYIHGFLVHLWLWKAIDAVLLNSLNILPKKSLTFCDRKVFKIEKKVPKLNTKNTLETSLKMRNLISLVGVLRKCMSFSQFWFIKIYTQ